MNTPRMTTNLILCAVVAMTGWVPQLAAQGAPQEQAAPAAAAPAEQQPGVIIRKESRLVLVDAVATDKKGNYVRDLAQKDFKGYDDNKEQPVASFSSGTDAAIQAKGTPQKHNPILFFTNSSMPHPNH